MNILKKPLVSEKISKMNEKNICGFIVDNKANKIQIKKEIEKVYKVKISKVNTIRYAGKKKTKHRKNKIIKGSTPSYKKALVYLKPGQILDIFNNI